MMTTRKYDGFDRMAIVPDTHSLATLRQAFGDICPAPEGDMDFQVVLCFKDGDGINGLRYGYYHHMMDVDVTLRCDAYASDGVDILVRVTNGIPAYTGTPYVTLARRDGAVTLPDGDEEWMPFDTVMRLRGTIREIRAESGAKRKDNT